MHAYTPTLILNAPGRPPTRSPYRCRRDSTTKRVRFAPMNRQEAARLYQQAERMECATRCPGRQDGVIGRNGLAVLRAFLFGFLNHKSGRCDPSHAALARRAGISERSVRRGLVALKAAGLVNWLRRCIETVRDGRFSLEQTTNAYAVLPPSQWFGWRAATPAPPPELGTWGDHPPLPDAITTALQNSHAGGGHSGLVAALEADPGDRLALALARFGKALASRPGGSNA